MKSMPEPIAPRHQDSGPTGGFTHQAASNTLRIRQGTADDIPVLARIETEAATLFPPDALPPALARSASTEELLAGVEAVPSAGTHARP